MNLKINIETLINYDHNIGKEFPLKLRLKFEDYFQADFSKVRIHEGFIAQEIGALALTSGSKIIFAPGSYCPDLKNGQRLIAHELTHVIQQREGRIPINHSAGPYLLDDFELENEAEQCADAFISGQKYANISRAHTPYQNCATVVQPAKVNLQYISTYSDNKNLQRTYWEDFKKILDILTTPDLFKPALQLLENDLGGASLRHSSNRQKLSDVLLKNEQAHGININGAPIYVGVLTDDDFGFKAADARAGSSAGNLAKDHVTAAHGDYTHRIHWYIIMCYCGNNRRINRGYALTNPALQLLRRSTWPSFIVPQHRWPIDQILLFMDMDITEHLKEGSEPIIKPDNSRVLGNFLWVALFDRRNISLNYQFKDDGLTQPEIFTSLFLPEQFNINGNLVFSQNKVERKIPGAERYYNYSEEFPMLSGYIFKRFIKRMEAEQGPGGIAGAEARYLQKKRTNSNYEFAKASQVDSSLSSEKVLFWTSDYFRSRSTIIGLVDLPPDSKDIDSFKAIQVIEQGRSSAIDLAEYEMGIMPNLRSAILEATANYLIWQDHDKKGFFYSGFTILNRHADDGKERAKKVRELCKTDNPLQILQDFAKGKINTSITGSKISGSINTNAHSYISFILDRIQKNDILIGYFATINGSLNKEKEKTMKDAKFFADDAETKRLRAAYLEDFKKTS